MIDIQNLTAQFLAGLTDRFGKRVWFVGLQGSYGRGEATENSDIDLVVILDELSPADLHLYGTLLDSLPHRELLCGFLSGKQEIFHWDPADLFQFYHDTTPILGSLDDLLPRIRQEDVNRAIRTGVCNLFHGCVHNMLYEKSEDILKGLYKAAAFVIQAIYFRQTGTYIRSQKDLVNLAAPEEQRILDLCLRLKAGGAVDFTAMSETLFSWCQHWIHTL